MQASDKQFAIADLEERKKSECAWVGVRAFSRHSLKSRYTCIGGPMSGYAERPRPRRLVVRKASRDIFRHWRSEHPERVTRNQYIGITRNLIELRETEIDALIRKGILKADARHLGKVGNWPSVAARATVSRAKNL